MNGHASPVKPVALTTSKITYKVLYTHQKQKKAKCWQDGLLHYSPSTKKASLTDEDKNIIESGAVKVDLIYPDAEFDMGKFLVQVESTLDSELAGTQLPAEIPEAKAAKAAPLRPKPILSLKRRLSTLSQPKALAAPFRPHNPPASAAKSMHQQTKSSAAKIVPSQSPYAFAVASPTLSSESEVDDEFAKDLHVECGLLGYDILYTMDIQKKLKKWIEGFMTYDLRSETAKFFDAEHKMIYKAIVPKDKIQEGAEFEAGRRLLQIDRKLPGFVAPGCKLASNNGDNSTDSSLDPAPFAGRSLDQLKKLLKHVG